MNIYLLGLLCAQLTRACWYGIPIVNWNVIPREYPDGHYNRKAN